MVTRQKCIDISAGQISKACNGSIVNNRWLFRQVL